MAHSFPVRRSIRLPDYNYSIPGAYFVTICTVNKNCLFGEIKDGIAILNEIGNLVFKCWQKIPNHFSNAQLDEFIVMPNHLHGLIIIGNFTGEACLAPTTNPTRSKKDTLGSIIGSFKSSVTKHAKNFWPLAKGSFWQRGYYEHIVRNDDELNHIREYIAANPIRWDFDRENPGI